MLVHPYRGEGFGLPILEAMACGLPAIVPRGGACLDFCTDRTSLFVDAPRRELSEEELGIETVGRAWVFEPDVRQLQDHMRAVARRPAALDSLSREARRRALSFHLGGRGPRRAGAPRAPRPRQRFRVTGENVTVSLCIVARNEAHFIGRAIASARALVDQIVVVDTGSTDGTPEVARRAGAEVSLAAWPGDLGRAHDLPLELAKGDWVLALDADEALDPSAAERLPVLTQGPADGYRFTVRNYDYRPALKWRSANLSDPLTLGAPGWSPSWAVRLFRNDGRYRNRGRLHQSVHRAIVAAGGTVADTDIPVHHYGMLRFDREKGSFYLQLAGAEAHDDPERPRVWLELGVAQMSAGDTKSARVSFERAFQLSGNPAAAFHLGRCLLASHEPGAAAEMLTTAISANGRDDSLDFDLADAWEELARAREARGDLEGGWRRVPRRTVIEAWQPDRPDEPRRPVDRGGPAR